MRINPCKSKAVSFTKARVREIIRHYCGNQLIPKASKFKHLGIIIRSFQNWADHVNYTLRRAWKALHFIRRVLKKRNNNSKRLAYAAMVRPILEYGAVCWDPYREGQVSALTFWRRNYFFNFSTLCIYNVNNTGTKQVRIMKQTAF